MKKTERNVEKKTKRSKYWKGRTVEKMESNDRKTRKLGRRIGNC